MAPNGVNNGNGSKRTISFFQMILACIGTAISVFIAQNSLLSGKVSVDSESLFRESVNRRLGVLEAGDARLEARIEKHDERDNRIFSDLEARIRASELVLARMNSDGGRRKAAMPARRAPRDKPIIARDLHEALVRVLYEVSPYYRVVIDQRRMRWPKLP